MLVFLITIFIVLVEMLIYFILLKKLKKKYNKVADLKVVDIITSDVLDKSKLETDNVLLIDEYYYVDLLWENKVKNVHQIYRNYKTKHINKKWKFGSKIKMWYNDKNHKINTFINFKSYLTNGVIILLFVELICFLAYSWL